MSRCHQGVILAAGRGTRIAPLGDFYPKPLLPVCNKPIISHQLDCMRSIGISEVFIVCGHKKERLKREVGLGEPWGLRLRYVEQEELYGIAHSLSLVEPLISGPFLVFLGDICFVPLQMKTMPVEFEEHGACAVLAVSGGATADEIRMNFEVLLSANGTVRKVVEKPLHPGGSVKGCGIYLFDVCIFDAIRKTPRTSFRNEFEITTAIQILIDDGMPVHAVESVAWDINVTDVNDLLQANLKMLDSRGLNTNIGEEVRIHPGADISRSVIGNDVVVSHPIQISNSLIMAGSRICRHEDLHLAVTNGDHVINCSKS